MDLKLMITFTLLATIKLAQGQVAGNMAAIARSHCTSALNQLRVARGLVMVSWDDFLVQLADLKGLQLVVDDNGIDFEVPTFDANAITAENITFNSQMMTKEINIGTAGKITGLHRQLFFSHLVDDIIRTWYMDGLFNLESPGEKFDSMMDATVDLMGCTLHALPLNDTTYRVYFVVAYKQNKERLEQYNDPKLSRSSGNTQRLSPSDRACSVSCSSSGSCYSHKYSEGHVGSRTGGNTMLPSEMQATKGCSCDTDSQLSTAHTKFEKPRCTETCFVNCPLATDSGKKTCYGQRYCTCLYAQGGAVCV